MWPTALSLLSLAAISVALLGLFARRQRSLVEEAERRKLDAERRAGEEAALREVVRALGAATGVSEVVQTVAHSAVEWTRAFGAYLETAEVPEPGAVVEVVAVAGEGAPPVGTRVPYPGSLTEAIIASGEPELMTEVGTIGESMAPYLRRSCRRCAGLAIPLFAEGRVLGALVLLRSPLQGPFGRDEAVFARALGDAASAALRRVLLLKELRESEARFRELAENVREVLMVVEPDFTRFLYVSPAYDEIWGRPAESLYRRPSALLDAVHPDDRERVVAATRSLSRGEEAEVECRVVRPDGVVRWVWVRGFPVRDLEGTLYRVVGVVEDVTERREREEVQRLLARAGPVLAGSLEHQEILESVARMAVESVADWCVVYLLEDGGLRRHAVAHQDPAREGHTRELLGRHPPDLDAASGVAPVVRSGEPALFPELSESGLHQLARSEGHFRALRELGTRSVMIVPMVARGRVVGAMNFVGAESGRTYGPDDLAFAEELAGRAALALDNARLFEAVEAARRRADAILESITDAFFAVDGEGRLTYVNRRGEEVLQRSREELLGRNLWEEFPEALDSALRAECARAQAERVTVEFETFHPTLGAWVEVRAYPSTEGLSVYFRDVSERRRARELVDARARQQEAVARLGQRALGGVELDALMDEAVRSVAESLGVELAKVLKSEENGDLLLQAGVGWKAGSVGSARVGGGRDSQAGYTLLSGEPVIVEDLRGETRFTGPPLLHEHGVVSGMSVVIEGREKPWGVLGAHTRERRSFTRDEVSFLLAMANVLAQAVERERSDQERRWLLQREREARGEAERRAREEAALRAAAEAVGASFTVEEVIHQIARSALEATGSAGAIVKQLDIEARDVRVVAVAGDRVPEPGTRGPYDGSLTAQVVERLEAELVPSIADAERPIAPDLVEACGDCSALVVPLVDAGQPIGSLVLLRPAHQPFHPDEVARAQIFANLASLAFRRVHLLQDAERRREELERISESRARLMRGFGHDVRNPLGAADGYAELLEEGLMGPLTETQRESVGRLRRSIQSALGLIDDLLELARAEAGEIEVRPAPTDVREAVREVAEEYRAQAEGKGLAMEVSVPGDFPVIASDPDRVRQILGNLLSNAVKYTSDGGVSVRVTAEEENGGPIPGPCICVAVADTGPGIPEEKRHLLFREFVRLHPGAGQGAGVGLAMSRQVARALGGEVTVESAPGRGSTFTLWLPMSHRMGDAGPDD